MSEHDLIPAHKLNALFKALPKRRAMWTAEDRRRTPRVDPADQWLWTDERPRRRCLRQD
jgi:hypothetical protein